MLQINNLTKSYKEASTHRTILDKLEFTLSAGSSLSIQGSSGSGKSTLLHLIAALDKPDEGEIVFQKPDTSEVNIHNLSEKQADSYRRSVIGIIFQRFNLIDCISVEENIYLPAKLNSALQDDLDDAYIKQLVGGLGIDKLLKKLPQDLSGGEQQRVAIARAMSHKPKMILADEPTGNLDNKTSEVVSDLLFSTCDKFKTSLIVVTHSKQVAEYAEVKTILSNGKLSVIH